MATTTTNPDIELTSGDRVPARPAPTSSATDPKPSHRDALQALLAFSALHEQIRRRKALASTQPTFDSNPPAAEFEPAELLVLDDVLQLVADRAVAITGADGLAIALAQNNEIVLRASAGMVRPDPGARIDRNSAFSGACFRTAEVVICEDTEVDQRVDVQACRKLGARSMVAVPLCGRRRVIGVLEAFSSWPFAFNESDVQNLTLLAELVLAALKPEDEDRFAESAQVAAAMLEPAAVIPAPPKSTPPITPGQIAKPSAIPQTFGPVTAPVPPAPTKPSESIEPPLPAGIELKPAQIETAPFQSKAPEKIEPKLPAHIESKLAPEIQTEAVPAISSAANPDATITLAVPKDETPVAPVVEAAAAEKAVEPALTFGQLGAERASRRWVPFVLVFIVIGVAIAGAAWWKLKTAQLGSEMIRAEAMPARPAAQEKAPAASSPATADDAITAVKAIPAEGREPALTPATPQEMLKFPQVTSVRHWSSPDSSTVVLDMGDQVLYEAHRLAEPDRIYVDLHDTQLAAELAGKSIDVGDPFVRRIRVAQPVAGMTRIVLETKPDTVFAVSLETSPYRLMVAVRKPGANPQSAVNLFPTSPGTQKSSVSIVVPPPTKEDLQLRARVPKMRIVVDAGHGGWDLGTVGRRGLLEKDLVLEIAQRLGKLLESRLGADVVYTRKDDNYIPLDERAEIANQAQADLFVSVHANYSDLPSARGVETYYTNFFSAPGTKEAGSKEAGSNTGGAVDARSVAGSLTNAITLTPAELHDRIEQSRHLAASVQRSLYGTLSLQNPGLRDRGVREAGFVVLTESAMPGILAEVSFVSSPTDEQKLRSDGYREEIAEALYKGIARYAASSKGVRIASKQLPVASSQ